MGHLQESLQALKDTFLQQVKSIDSQKQVEDLKIRFLGKKGELTQILRGMGQLDASERPLVGQIANDIREQIEQQLTEAQTKIKLMEQRIRMEHEAIDVTMPGKMRSIGGRHPLTLAINEICGVFLGLGFSIAEGPEVELDHYNFEMLRIPADHPARDSQDTFYITEQILLRSQTSPVQIRVMEQQKPPIKIVCPGKVYRSDALDATHSPIFHQIEGLVVDKGVTMGDLVGSLRLFAKKLFGENTEIRLRPHHFQFTEPSCEVDVTCWSCGGVGCRTCKGEGWVEVLGAGMVHPGVLQNCGIDPEIYSGFAFGIGVERTAMARFGIDDIRLFFENDVRFLSQFK